MGSEFLAHLRGQWMGALALFLVLTGGVAYAANTVFSSDIVNDQVFSADVRNDTLAGGGLAAHDLRSGSVATAEINDGAVRPADVQNESLTGADIKDRSGVDTCPDDSERLGELCVASPTSPLSGHTPSTSAATWSCTYPPLGKRSRWQAITTSQASTAGRSSGPTSSITRTKTAL